MIRSFINLRKSKDIFQLCRKNPLAFYFNTQKGSFSNQDKSSQADAIKQSAKKNMEKLKRLQQQQRQQKYQQKLQEINITKGGFNPLTAYFWLHRKGIFLVSLGVLIVFLLIHEDSLFCYKTMGVFQDPFTKKKRFLIINPYREKLLENTIISIIEKQVNILDESSFEQKNAQVNKILQKKLQNVLAKLETKYSISFEPRKSNNKNFQIADSGENMCLWVIGNKKLIASTKVLKLSPENLQNLILLMYCLHERYLHVQNVSFWERMNLQSSTKTTKIIKLQKTFISNIYSAQSIAQTVNFDQTQIELMSEKYEKDLQSQQKLKQGLNRALKNVLQGVENKNELLKKRQFPDFDLRSRLKIIE